jgi:hypothetical protein
VIIIRGFAFQLKDPTAWSSFASLCLHSIRLIYGDMVFHIPQLLRTFSAQEPGQLVLLRVCFMPMLAQGLGAAKPAPAATSPWKKSPSNP